MIVIRPVENADIDQLFDLASKTGAGLTTLPANKKFLEQRITNSIQAFASTENSPIDACYLLVLDDIANKRVAGTSGVAAAVGLHQPFYTYKLNTAVSYSQSLDIYKKLKFLTLTNDFTGCSELCSLFLSPDYRGGNNGILLSKSRFLMMANQPNRFAEKVIAEMRGFSDEQGKSPFWESVGRHFFDMDFEDADRANGEGNQQFIAELVPHHPIYLPMLSKEAQAVIGDVHPKTKPAIKILEAEGFYKTDYVDIFDAGPTIESRTHDITSIKDSYLVDVNIGEVKQSQQESSLAIISNTNITNFRSCVLRTAKPKTQSLTISSNMADALMVNQDDQLRVKFYS